MKCRQRLYLTADRKKIVPQGDKKAATLYAVPGDEIPNATHDAFGLVDGHLKGFDPDAEAASEPEPVEPEPTITAAQVLYLSKDGKSVLEEGSDDAGELYVRPGDLIPQSAHDAFGLVEGHLPDFDPEFDAKAKALAAKADEDLAGVEAAAAEADAKAKADADAATKEAPPAKDKEQKGGADKQSKPATDTETQTGAGAGDGAGAGGAAQAGVSGETV